MTTIQTTTPDFTIDEARKIRSRANGVLEIFAVAEELGIYVDPTLLAETRVAILMEEWGQTATILDEPIEAYDESYRELVDGFEIEAPGEVVPYDTPGRDGAKEYFGHVIVLDVQGKGVDIGLDDGRFKMAFPEELE